MSDKKIYTPREVAVQLLKKAEDLMKHKHIGWNKLHGKLEGEGYSKESADKIAGAIKAKVEKAEPKGEIHPKEEVAGEADAPGERTKHQLAPQDNPKEEAEGNNPPPGAFPENMYSKDLKGHQKLATFMAKRHEAKKSRETGSEMDKSDQMGVHSAVDSGNFAGPGTSKAGQMVRGAHRDADKPSQTDYNAMKTSTAKKHHGEKLQELKSMPKPTLPKSEAAMQEKKK